MSRDATELHPGVLHHVVNSLGWNDLRPLQRAAIEPVRDGLDCLLLAPTAGGKTEAAAFPLLSEMAESHWQGLSVLYITPLKALLNNLQPRLDGYATWIGRRVGVRHGDVSQGERKRLLKDPPDILLTTPESLESMLVSTGVDHHSQFANLRAVVVDELHAFAGDDRGWHLLAVLERLQHLAGHRLQRIGLTATVGNPEELLTWLQGSGVSAPAVVVAPEAAPPAAPEITIDYVGSVANAARVVASLHQGEKRLVFSDSRAQAEEMATHLRDLGTTTFVSHSSLSAPERRRSEEAFAAARDCVVVATSTLELGIDVGDLDRVIQLEAPRTVASFLQRLGRTGRRPGSVRNCLFLATREETLLRAAALTTLWGRGYVEPVTPPPLPMHIAAQQFLALALQEGTFGINTWREWWGDIPVMERGDEILAYLLEAKFLDQDSGLAFIGPEAEQQFGRRHFMELLSAFTVDPEMTVLTGRSEIGSVSPLTLSTKIPKGERRILTLAGRNWEVTDVDWRHRRIQVVEHHGAGRSRWSGGAPDISYALAQATRDVLLGTEPPVELSRRGEAALEAVRAERSVHVDDSGLVVQPARDGSEWWTFAGSRANNSLVAGLTSLGLTAQAGPECVTFGGGLDALRALPFALEDANPAMAVDQAALDGLKFSAALATNQAEEVLMRRGSDEAGAKAITAQQVVAQLDLGGLE